MVRQTARVIILEILAGFGILSMLAMGTLALRLSAGPLELGLFKDDIETALESVRDGRAVTLDTVTLEWLANENRAVIVATDLQVFDAEGTLSARAERAEILLDTGGLLLGKVRPIGLALSAGVIEVHRGEDGWMIAGDPVGSQVESVDTSTDLSAENVLEIANQGLIDLLALLRRDAEGFALQTIRFDGFDLFLTEANRGERARLANATGSLRRNTAGIEIHMQAENVTDRESAPAGFVLGISAPGDYSRIDAQIAMTDWSLEALSKLFARDADWVQDMMGDVSLSFGVDAKSGLGDVLLAGEVGPGEMQLGAAVHAVTGLAFEGRYVPDADRLTLDLNEFGIGPASGGLAVVLESVLNGAGARAFALEAPGIDLDLRPVFGAPWALKRIAATGTADIANRQLDLETFSFRTGEATVRASGLVELLEEPAGRDIPVKTDMVVEISGKLLADELLDFWPVQAAASARKYVRNNVSSGYLTGATARIVLRRDSRAAGYLENDALEVVFEAVEIDVQPLDDLPVVHGTSIVGQATGNTLKIDFSGGRFEDWNLSTGQVHYPQLSPAGGDMNVRVEGSGPAETLVRVISDSRLQLQARTGFDPSTVSGDADMSLTLVRPTARNTSLSDFRYHATGNIRNGGLTGAFNDLALDNSDAYVTVDETGMSIAGVGKLGASPIDYEWSYNFGAPGSPSRFHGISVINPDILNAFGIVGRAYFTGEIPVQFDALLDGTRPRAIDAEFDLLQARLDVAELGWIKPAGEPATASLSHATIDGVPMTRVVVDSADAEFDGAFSLLPDGKLVSADIKRAFLKDRADVIGIARRTEDEALLFELDAVFLDLSELVGNMRQFGDTSSTAAQIGDVEVHLNAERLQLREGFETRDTALSLVSNENGMQTLEAQGKLPNGADISGAYDASGLGDPSFLFNSGDAGFVANVFLGSDALEDGTMQISGTFATGDLPTQIRMVIENGRLKDAPFITQVLSIASLRGLSDTLSGDGVLFTEIEVPVTITDGRYNIVGARASGPALGLTANGWVTPANGGIDIDGVLVPSFGLNSALGGLPLIGDLFVSRDGEGVISLRYSIEGTLERAQVSVNPLSAITPGVLRRIFENPAKEPLPPIADETGKNEAAPIPGE